MIKKISYLLILLIIISCKENRNEKEIKLEVNNLVNNWHKDVANYNFDAYFNAMTDDAIFIGTDASENWNKKAFKKFTKLHFDKRKTWNFKPLERNIYISENGKIVWFDELLDTWMRVCRGSGVLVKQNNAWKIKHYVLSTTIPNDSMKKIVKIKALNDSVFMRKFN